MKERIAAQMPRWIKWTHLGLAIFGVTAYFTAELAEYSDGFGYYLHAYLGLTLLVFLLGRIVYGVIGQSPYRFVSWFPHNLNYISTIKEDIHELMQLKVPERPDHRGLSGLVQAFGLIVFSWMAVTGAIMFILGSSEESAVTELHEIGESLVPLFLIMHVGAVVIHVIFGKNNLTKMLPFISKPTDMNV